MATSPRTTDNAPPGSSPIRIEVREQRQVGGVDGAWWPYSRDFAREAGQLVDYFDLQHHRVQRLLFSRPDWDDVVFAGKGLRRIQASRGPVKVGSFPKDDTHQVIVTLGGGQRLTIAVVAPGTSAPDAHRAMQATVA